MISLSLKDKGYSMAIEILVIEDDKRLSELLKRSLEESAYYVDIASNGETGRILALNKDYDLIISDVMLPGINGIELCKTIRKEKPHIPIIMLTALGETNDKIDGFDAGADDYLVKPFDFRELEVRIKALLKRSNLQNLQNDDETIVYEDIELNIFEKTVKRNRQEINLTPKEFNLLHYLLKNKERVVSREEIAKNVWDTHFDTGTNFIDVYINYLRKKIDKPFNKKLIYTKSGMGFILKANS